MGFRGPLNRQCEDTVKLLLASSLSLLWSRAYLTRLSIYGHSGTRLAIQQLSSD